MAAVACDRASLRLPIIVAVLLLFAGASSPAAAAAGASSSNRYPPLAPGLSFDFYKKSCPQAESIVRSYLKEAIEENVVLAGALIRIHFHDCFVQGCDASVLLDNSTVSGTSEQTYVPNQTLRPAAFNAINDIRSRLEQACGRVVSCADIVALSARESVGLSGGPSYKVPLGRRDGLSPASQAAVFAGLPSPASKVPALMAVLSKINLDVTDLVALSGGHTVGRAHCGAFDGRLFPTQDGTMNQWFAGHLKLTCPAAGTDNVTVNDIRTPNAFDNKYYVDLLNREGLFTSDQDLLTNATTRPIVTAFAVDQQSFFDQFVYSYVKMGQIQVLTGSQGQIRANCSARNTAAAANDDHHRGSSWSGVVDTVVEAAETLIGL